MIVNELEKLGHQYFETWQLARAEELLTYVAKSAPTRDFAPFLLGEVFRRRGEWSQACVWYLEAYQRGRIDGSTVYRCGEGLFRTGDKEGAIAWFTHLIQTDPPGPRREQAELFLSQIQ